MPKFNGYGYGEFTAKKFSDCDIFFRDYLGGPVCGVLAKYGDQHWCSSEFHYIDMNAGPGILPNLYDKKGKLLVPEGTLGSPFIFNRHANLLKINYRADFIEKESEWGLQLSSNVIRNWIPRQNVRVWIDDHSNALRKILPTTEKWKFGLVYHDPNNGEISFDALKYCVQKRPKYEILINFPGGLFKRSPSHYKDEIYISLHLERLKKYWFVKDLAKGDKHQWTFLLGTDWEGMKEYPSVGLMSILKPKGAKIFERIDKSKNQIKKKV
jgi:hypothetical protein